MKFLPVILGVLGGIAGIITTLVVHNPYIVDVLPSSLAHIGLTPAQMTGGLATIGLLAALFMLVRPLVGAWICLIVSVLGIFTASELWEAAGSLFFMAAILGFFGRNDVNQAAPDHRKQ